MPMLQNASRTTTGSGQSTIYPPMPGKPANGGGGPIIPPPGGVIRYVFRTVPPMLLGLGLGFAIEMCAPDNYKISALTGGFVGHERYEQMMTELDAVKATAAANADAAVHAQQQVAEFTAKTQRLTQACEALYTQNSAQTQSINEMNQRYFALRQELIAKSQEFKNSIAQLADAARLLGPMLGYPQLGQIGKQFGDTMRQEALDDMDRAMRQGLDEAMNNTKRFHPGMGNMNQIDRDIIANCTDRAQIVPEVKAPPQMPRYKRPA